MAIPEISVIIPVYNAEKYLPSCIDSILAQTFKDFELLLVDDGSTDRSGEICDEYAVKDSRIRVIHKKNEGKAFYAILRGLHEAKSDWVAIQDDDDTLESDALESLYSMHEGTDLVIGFFELPDYRLSANATLDESRHAFLAGKLSFPLWAKLYRKNIITEVFEYLNVHAKTTMDMIMNTYVFFRMTRPPHVLYKHIYNYRRNPVSSSHVSKASVEYEDVFYQTIYDAIPEDQLPKYLHELTSYKINGLFKIAYSHPETLVDKQQPYLKRIREDAKKCHYHLSLMEHLLLSSSSNVVIKIVGFLNLAFHSLHYRLLVYFRSKIKNVK